MYDFCFTPFYSAFLAFAGLYGYYVKGSLPSLGGGVGAAAALGLLSTLSFKLGYSEGRACHWSVGLQLGIASSLTMFAYTKFTKTQGAHLCVLAFVSGLMCAYYVWNLTLYRPKPKQHKSAAKQE